MAHVHNLTPATQRRHVQGVRSRSGRALVRRGVAARRNSQAGNTKARRAAAVEPVSPKMNSTLGSSTAAASDAPAQMPNSGNVMSTCRHVLNCCLHIRQANHQRQAERRRGHVMESDTKLNVPLGVPEMYQLLNAGAETRQAALDLVSEQYKALHE